MPSSRITHSNISVSTDFIDSMKHFLEPIGGSKPKFSINSDSQSFTHAKSESLSLSCPAQGSPIPTFRLVLIFIVCEMFRAHWRIKTKVCSDNRNPLLFLFTIRELQCHLSSSGIAHSIISVSQDLSMYHFRRAHWRIKTKVLTYN